jgi:hypothetical protein
MESLIPIPYHDLTIDLLAVSVSFILHLSTVRSYVAL